MFGFHLQRFPAVRTFLQRMKSLRVDEYSKQLFAIEWNQFPVLITVNGTTIAADSFPGFSPLAISKVNGVNIMFWKFAQNNTVHNKTFDASWRFVASGGYYVFK
jgi:hypothetical protein